MEQDDREGIVRNYLDMLLPDDWDSMDYYRRREYIRDIDDPTRSEGTMKRQTVSRMLPIYGRQRVYTRTT